MDGGAEAVLVSANRAFDLAHVAVRGNDVKGDGEQIGADALELVIAIKIANCQAACLVDADGIRGGAEDSGLGSVRNWSDRTVADAPRNGVVERVPLFEEGIGAKSDVAMMLQNWCGNGNGLESWDVRGSGVR